jgi:hypothetical protein
MKFQTFKRSTLKPAGPDFWAFEALRFVFSFLHRPVEQVFVEQLRAIEEDGERAEADAHQPCQAEGSFVPDGRVFFVVDPERLRSRLERVAEVERKENDRHKVNACVERVLQRLDHFLGQRFMAFRADGAGDAVRQEELPEVHHDEEENEAACEAHVARDPRARLVDAVDGVLRRASDGVVAGEDDGLGHVYDNGEEEDDLDDADDDHAHHGVGDFVEFFSAVAEEEVYVGVQVLQQEKDKEQAGKGHHRFFADGGGEEFGHNTERD